MRPALGFIFISLLLISCSKDSPQTPSPPPQTQPSNPPPVIIPPPTITGISPDSGYVGDQIVIFGTNFNPIGSEDSVFIGGVLASIISASTNQMVVEIPPGANTGTIRITVNNQTVSSSFDFAVISTSWIQTTDFGGNGRIGAVAFSIGGKGYILHGSTASGTANSLYAYDTSSKEWTRKADYPAGGRRYPVAFVINNKAYVGLGFDGTNDAKDFWEYDPGLDKWTQKTDFPGAPRISAVGFSINGRGYVGLGTKTNHPDQNYIDFWEYDPETDTWSPKASYLGSNSAFPDYFSVNAYGYVLLGGITPTNPQQPVLSKEVWRYDPLTNTWTRKNDFPGEVRVLETSFSVNNKGYIGMGIFQSGSYSKEIWEYDPLTDSWRHQSNAPMQGRLSSVGFSIGSIGYIALGQDYTGSTYFRDVWQFRP